MIVEAILFTKAFQKRIAELKKVSPTYPRIYTLLLDREAFHTTLVRWEFNGVVYSRHHVEYCHKSPNFSEPDWDDCINKTLERLKASAELCIEKAIPCKYDDVIGVKND